ncbi:MAG: hypothetical protein GY814_15305 [Gammaproteobacteria bacterium]|nr:hypothetical protein [Gammaproteobacteria bacterium]
MTQNATHLGGVFFRLDFFSLPKTVFLRIIQFQAPLANKLVRHPTGGKD